MFNLKMTTANTQEKKLAGQQRTRPNMGNNNIRAISPKYLILTTVVLCF